MNNKYKVITVTALLATSFAFGRYSAPEVVKKEVTEVESKTKDSNKHTETTTTETTKPDGTKTTTTTTTMDTEHHTAQVDQTHQIQSVTVAKGSALTVSALIGIPILPPGVPIYGGQISRPLVGPVSLGLWGLSNGIVGVSIGLSF